MKLIFVYGMPASGKLTVAKELAAVTGYKLFHNHLVVDLLLPVFEFGSEEFVRLREEMWMLVFAEACRSGVPGMIFTFAPERTVTEGFIGSVVELVARMGGEIEFVQLVCPTVELRARMDEASRRAYGKLTSLEMFDKLLAEGAFEASGMPEARVTVDTGTCSPREASESIAKALVLPDGPATRGAGAHARS
ncbi:hypothetical protein HDF16_001770 [Granulicella aggregans]|uniref:Shikimate kinase n=1 Tax=Granulicella aggregans TaxID=474949 RepID=A0A7W7ZBX9_9BACT|nr:AAA family ATPase [Granulicella aggregans]MBB5057085.1 hypothetical protein [Granulicella aggregans]